MRSRLLSDSQEKVFTAIGALSDVVLGYLDWERKDYEPIDGTAHGGHLLEGHVRPTLEVVVHESPEHLRRVLDPQSGLALIDVE